MKKLILALTLTGLMSVAGAQDANTTTVITENTNNNTVSGGTVNTNTNINTNDTTVNSVNTNTNINTNNNTSVNTNNNINSGHTTSANENTNINDSTNRNYNESTSNSTQSVNSVNRNDNYNRSDVNQKIEQPPPSAIAPPMMSGGNSDLCTTGVSGAVQTQILGISGGTTVRDLNCERLKNAKTLYDMGMKVAAVATLCQDRRVFDAMWNAGTPCPFEGKIGEQARAGWEANPHLVPKPEKINDNQTIRSLGTGFGLGALLMLLL